MRSHRTPALGAALLALIVSACAPGGGSQTEGESPGERPPVIVGSAGFYEAALIGEIYAQALESKGYDVERRLELGERPAVYTAFESGDINLAPDYLGGALEQQFGGTASADAEETLAALQEELAAAGFVAFEASPGTDADGFAVRAETAEDLGLATMSDVAEVADQLVWGLAPACADNPNCGPGLEEVYGIDIGQLEVENLGPCSTEMAEALNNSAIDVAQVCTTQPDIERFGFVVLEDDQGLQPAQNIVPIATLELAEAAPADLEETLNAVSELLTTEELIALGVLVAVEQQSFEDVASQWLEDNGLI